MAIHSIAVCLLFWGSVAEVYGQSKDTPIQTFGYFQISFRHDEAPAQQDRANSYSVQQLNLIFQKNFSRQWSAFVNFELLNNFSSSRRWGSLDLDEAWLSYRTNHQLTLKAGLHVPVFNHLNEIKNRTPLLPYIIRPLVYEESFAEIVNIEEFVPNRAFMQASGTVPIRKARIDYAGYLGNSPNINSQLDNEQLGVTQQSGLDTTTTVLVGGRIGLRIRELKLGISGTSEVVNFFRTLAESAGGEPPAFTDVSPDRFNGVRRNRLGVDFSFYINKFSFEGELINVSYDVDIPPELSALPGEPDTRIDVDRLFYYGTIGYSAAEHLLVYGSYWYTKEAFFFRAPNFLAQDKGEIKVYSVGARYSLFQDENGFDRIALKAQYAHVPIVNQHGAEMTTEKLNTFSLAISVLF